MRSLLVTALMIGFACSVPTVTPDAAPPPACGLDYLGDRNKDVAFEFRVVGGDGVDMPLSNGDDAPLIFPPQGGRVVFVGVRAQNLDPCAVQLTGALRDLSTRQVRVDSRTVNLIPDGKGWGTSGTAGQSITAAVSNYSNIPLCPNQWSATNVFGTQYQLEVTLKDHDKKTITKTILVTPRCAEPGNASECLCICKGGYVLGESCAMDGGTKDAADQ